MKKSALTNKGRELFPKLSNFTDFYLAGGTALALQIGHRVSVDFDLFRDKEIEKDFFDKIKKVFGDYKIEPLVNNKDELTVRINEVKVTFLNYPFPVLQDFEIFEDVKLLKAEEIGATKAYTLGRRATYKDYVDLYFIFKENKSSLNDIIRIANQKYGEEFNDRLFLEQLVTLEDVSGEEEINFLGKEIKKEEIKIYFEKLVKDILF